MVFQFICAVGACEPNGGGLGGPTKRICFGLAASPANAWFYGHRFYQCFSENEKRNRMERAEDSIVIKCSVTVFSHSVQFEG